MYYPVQSKLNFGAIVKALTFIVCALLITFLLFVLMHKLTKMDDVGFKPQLSTVVIDPIFHEKDTDTIERIKAKPRQEPKARPENVQPKELVDPSGQQLVLIDNIAFQKPTLNTDIQTNLTAGGGEARPIVRIEPKYPIDAARDGIEGWVRLSFTIASSGQVVDIEVVDAEPKRTFDREAKRALAKWKYQPQFVDGHAKAQENMMVVLEFKLSEG